MATEKKSRWDLPPSDAAQRAARAAALVNAKLAAEGHLAAPPPSIVTSVPTTGIVCVGDTFSLNIEINDSPNRATLTRKSFMDDVCRRSGASLTTKGKYFAPGEPRDAASKPLYLFVQGKTREDVAAAAALIHTQLGTQTAADRAAPPDPLIAIEKLFVNLDAVPGFDVRAEVTGPGGSYLKHIETETEARVWLRGQGSGHHEPGTTKEAAEPMHIAVQHSKQPVVDKAKALCHNLLQTIRQKHETARLAYQNSLYAFGIGAPPPPVYSSFTPVAYHTPFVAAPYPPLPPGPPPILQPPPPPAPVMVAEPEPRKRKFVEKDPEPLLRPAVRPPPPPPPPAPRLTPTLAPTQPAKQVATKVHATGPLVAYSDDDSDS